MEEEKGLISFGQTNMAMGRIGTQMKFVRNGR